MRSAASLQQISEYQRELLELENEMAIFDEGASPFQDDMPETRAAPRPATRKVRLTVKPSKPKVEKTQSSIGFPYMDLDAAITVAQAMHSSGGVALSREQLAGVMGLQASGGGFITKVATARIFGLVSFSQGRFELTDLGFAILDRDDARSKSARREAFLNVPLYKRVYDDFRGKQLPPRPLGLEQAFLRFGVAPKQTTNARLAFDKSARQAGFYSSGIDRLIEPIIGSSDRPKPDESEIFEDRKHTPQHVKILGVENHPFVQGLLGTLPEPNTNWTTEGRAKWLQAAANIFDLIYKGNGNIVITAETKNE